MPGERRGEFLTSCDTASRAVVVVLRCAQAGQDVAGVIGIRTPGLTWLATDAW